MLAGVLFRYRGLAQRRRYLCCVRRVIVVQCCVRRKLAKSKVTRMQAEKRDVSKLHTRILGLQEQLCEQAASNDDNLKVARSIATLEFELQGESKTLAVAKAHAQQRTAVLKKTVEKLTGENAVLLKTVESLRTSELHLEQKFAHRTAAFEATVESLQERIEELEDLEADRVDSIQTLDARLDTLRTEHAAVSFVGSAEVERLKEKLTEATSQAGPGLSDDYRAAMKQQERVISDLKAQLCQAQTDAVRADVQLENALGLLADREGPLLAPPPKPPKPVKPRTRPAPPTNRMWRRVTAYFDA